MQVSGVGRATASSCIHFGTLVEWENPIQDMLHSRSWSSASLCTAERSWILCFCHAKVGVVQEEMFFSYWCAHMTLNPWCHGHGLLRFLLSLFGLWLSWAISTGCTSIWMCLGSSNQHIKALEVAIGDLFVWIRSI